MNPNSASSTKDKAVKQLVASQTTGVVFSEGKEELPENTVGLSVA